MLANSISRSIVRRPFLAIVVVYVTIVVCMQPWSLLVTGQEATPYTPYPMPGHLHGIHLQRQTKAQADVKSAGCIQCHEETHDPHEKGTINLGCIDCHGGNAASSCKERAHVMPRSPGAWRSSANPVRSYTLLNHESPEFVRFVNPGDLRIAHISCGTCHPNAVRA